MDRRLLINLFQNGGSLLSLVLKNSAHPKLPDVEYPHYPVDESEPVAEPQQETTREKPQVIPRQAKGVSTEDTVQYQKRELSKELLLMEKHLQQGCKINGVACDCCEKHPIAIEGLAQETLGMTGDKLYGNILTWTKKVSPITTADASASGEHDEKYPKLAVEARELRKEIMGTANISALLDKKEKEAIKEKVAEVLDHVEDTGAKE